MKEASGSTFLIQKYSINDGPGLRTTVFMKGCPLHCWWCQNPESWHLYPELMTYDAKCILCGRCAQACPLDAIAVDPQKSRKIDRVKCNLCFECVEACPTGALRKAGDNMTVEQVMAEVEQDEIFYRRSGGGVTVSGGEPLLQWQFVYSLLENCKRRSYHTALDTCGYARWKVFEKVLEYTDLVLFDIKHTDPKEHKRATGKDNFLILKNLHRLAATDVKIWLRFPVIPDYNDSTENVTRLARLATEIGAEKISLLPYNELGRGKYSSLNRAYPLEGTKPPTKDHIQNIKDIIESHGVIVTIGS